MFPEPNESIKKTMTLSFWKRYGQGNINKQINVSHLKIDLSCSLAAWKDKWEPELEEGSVNEFSGDRNP